jgi:8-oxo-dGTP pyrophosphatase MutT (NUDIX family)
MTPGGVRADGAERLLEELRKLLLPVDPVPAAPSGLRPAGVLVPLRVVAGEIRVVLARRTERVPHHKGQVCFPGGSRDPGDRDLLATALRESHEELGIRPEDVELFGALSPVPTVTGFFIQPFLARVPGDSRFLADDFEIAEIFEVPLPAFTDLSRYRAAETSFLGKPYHVYFIDCGRHAIWGATANILHDLACVALRLPAVRLAAG